MDQVKVELNLEFLEQLQRAGYTHLQYRRRDGFSELTPLRHEIKDGADFYVVDINDEHAYEMAQGVINWRFYVLF
jgi:hypothetical protein